MEAQRKLKRLVAAVMNVKAQEWRTTPIKSPLFFLLHPRCHSFILLRRRKVAYVIDLQRRVCGAMNQLQRLVETCQIERGAQHRMTSDKLPGRILEVICIEARLQMKAENVVINSRLRV